MCWKGLSGNIGASGRRRTYRKDPDVASSRHVEHIVSGLRVLYTIGVAIGMYTTCLVRVLRDGSPQKSGKEG